MLQFILYEVFRLGIQTTGLTVAYRDDWFTNLILPNFVGLLKKKDFDTYFPRFYRFQHKPTPTTTPTKTTKPTQKA